MGLALLKQTSADSVLTVTVSPAFAAKWLLPRIDRFQALCPETDVRLDTSLKPVDFAAQGIDIGVRYGNGYWPGLVAQKLMEEEVFPVCAPTVLQRLGNECAPGYFAGETLIHDQSIDERAGFPSWDAWMAHAGISTGSDNRALKINNSAAVLQAAIEGHGVALARSVMARDDVMTGRLVRLFPGITLASPLSYYVVFRAESGSLPKLVRFRDWLLAEAKSI